jgi:hypothetical protein
MFSLTSLLLPKESSATRNNSSVYHAKKRTSTGIPVMSGASSASSIIISVCCVVAAVFVFSPSLLRTLGSQRMVVYSFQDDSPVAKKLIKDFQLQGINHVILDASQQRHFVWTNDCGIDQYDRLVLDNQKALAAELVKYCALSLHTASGAAYLDLSSPMLVRFSDLHSKHSLAVLSSSYIPKTIHASFLLLQKQHVTIAKHMLDLIVSAPVETLKTQPLLLPRSLYALIAMAAVDADHKNNNMLTPGVYQESKWNLLEQTCHMQAHAHATNQTKYWYNLYSHRRIHTCPVPGEFCCFVYDALKKRVVMMQRHPLHPILSLDKVVAQSYTATVQ